MMSDISPRNHQKSCCWGMSAPRCTSFTSVRWTGRPHPQAFCESLRAARCAPGDSLDLTPVCGRGSALCRASKREELACPLPLEFL